MAPVSRPMVALPMGSGYDPASVPSARSAVSTTPLAWPAGLTCAGAGAGSDAAGRASLKPHDAQNLLFGGLRCSHWGQVTRDPPPIAACTGGGGVTGASNACAIAPVPPLPALALGSSSWPTGMPMEVVSSTIAGAALAAGTPCGGVPPPNFLGDEPSRGSSAPQPRQNL
jgi:hypothetical protein